MFLTKGLIIFHTNHINHLYERNGGRLCLFNTDPIHILAYIVWFELHLLYWCELIIQRNLTRCIKTLHLKYSELSTKFLLVTFSCESTLCSMHSETFVPPSKVTADLSPNVANETGSLCSDWSFWSSNIILLTSTNAVVILHLPNMTREQALEKLNKKTTTACWQNEHIKSF